MTSSWMLVAGFFFAAMALFVKLGGAHFEAIELGFYRSLVAFVFIAGYVVAKRERVWNPHMGTHLLRSLAGTFGIIAYFYGISNLPLATATTLNYTSPLFLAVATTVVMREKFSRWLLVAIILGFVGVAMLLQPTFAAGREGAAMVGLFSGLLASWAYLGVRNLSQQGEPEWRILFWFASLGTVGCAAWQLAFSTFHPVRWDNAWMLAGIGVTGTAAQLAMTRAYRTGNTLVVGSLSYSTIVFSTLFMVTIWDDRLAPMGLAGIVVIVASGLIALRVEKKEQVEEAGFES
ncbi:MAG: DMT family transporter [Betaproteobacteria bacterium]|nr:DMT family transporter [Betaproteobacteria bacterium]